MNNGDNASTPIDGAIDPILAALEKSGQVVGGDTPPANEPAGGNPLADPAPIAGDLQPDNTISNNSNGGIEPATPADPVTPDPNAGSEDELDYFAKQLGISQYTKPAALTLDALVELAKTQIDEIKNQYAAYENPQVKGIIDHIMSGGTLEDYASQPQKSEYWAKFELTADNVAAQEQIMRTKFESAGFEGETLELLIEGLKNNNKLFSSAQSEVNVNRAAEIAYNTDVDNQINASREASKQFFNAVEQHITKNSLGVVTIANEDIETFKAISKPDSKGEIGIQGILDNLTDEQMIAVNYAAFRISKGDAIMFGKAGQPAPAGVGSKPIATILNKATNNPLAAPTADSNTFRELLKN